MRSRLDVTMVKAHNRRLVFSEVVARAPTTRAQIASNTGLSLGTVATIVDELCRRGVTREVKEERASGSAPVGRRPLRVEFLPDAKRIVCIDLATRHPTYCFKDLKLNTEQTRQPLVEHRPGQSYEERLRTLFRTVAAQAEESLDGAGERPVIGVGVSVPGPYRPTEDRISCKLVPELNTIRLRSLLREYFDYPIQIEHDVKLALGTEIKSIPYHEYKTIISIFLGEGVGSAISINGVVFGGAHEFAGEIGQMRVRDGGTLEEHVAWRSFLSRAQVPTELLEADNEPEIVAYLVGAYERGEPGLRSALDETIQTIAYSIANVVCVLNPHAIVVSGRYSIFGEGFIRELQTATERLVIDDLKRDLEFIPSSSIESDSIMGVASAVRDAWLDEVGDGAKRKEGK